MKRFGTAIILVFCSSLCAQDIHWSQFYNAVLYHNPAFAGLNGAYHAHANFRDQWNALGGTYKTFQFAGDFKIKNESEKENLNVGLVMYNDLSADGTNKTSSIGAMCSYHLKLNEHGKLGFGIGGNYVQKTVFTDSYTWGSQFNGEVYDPSLASGESKTGAMGQFSDFNLGLVYLFDESQNGLDFGKNATWFCGYSLNHINQPQMDLFGSTDELLFKHTLFAKGFFPGTDNLALKPNLLFMMQGKLMEITAGCLIRFGIGEVSRITGIKKGSGMSFGLLYRYRDAIIPCFEYEKGRMLFGLSYDVNLSKLSSATDTRGGLELSLVVKAPYNYLYQKKEKPKGTDSKPQF